MKLMLAEDKPIDVGSLLTSDDCMEGNGFDYVSKEFLITCRVTVISNPDNRRVEDLRHREGILNICLRTDIGHPKSHERPTSSMKIRDTGKLLTFIINRSCSDLLDQRKIRLIASIRISKSVVFDFDGRFYGIQMAGTDWGDLNFGNDPVIPCSWEAMMTLLTCQPREIRITLMMEIPSESHGCLGEGNVVSQTDMHVQSLGGKLTVCNKSILSGLSDLLRNKIRSHIDGPGKSILQLECSDAAFQEILAYACTGFFKTPRFSMNVAHELLEASRLYEMEIIWNAVHDKILFEREEEWFSPADCLNMFEYLVSLQGERSIVALAKKILVVFSSKQTMVDTSKFDHLMATNGQFRKAWLQFSCQLISEATVP